MHNSERCIKLLTDMYVSLQGYGPKCESLDPRRVYWYRPLIISPLGSKAIKTDIPQIAGFLIDIPLMPK